MAPDWFDFRNPDYERVMAQRVERLTLIRATPGMAQGLKEFYKDHPVEFIEDWGMTFDPRNVEIGLNPVIPFVLFPRQAEFIMWVVGKWRAREDGLAEKSRDMGVTWLCVSAAHWLWQFYAGTIVGFGSRKEEYVDKSGDPKSIFYKVRQYISLLPIEFRPTGYDEKKHAPSMRVTNPENESVIVGESGNNIGRGNRTSIYFKDESAFYEQPELIEAALSQTSNCKIDVSTPNGNGNPFARKRHSGKMDVFSFHWTQDPRKTQAWYDKQKNSLDAVVLAQEVDIDYNASVSDSWISGNLISEANLIGPFDLPRQVARLIVSIDAAHFGDDESIVHFRKGRLNLPQLVRNKLDGPQLAWFVEAEIDNFGEVPFAIIIELDGPGVSCFDQLKMGKYSEVVYGIHTGIRLSDGKNYNLRALLWRKAKEYLEDKPVSIARDEKFKSQISSLKYGYKDGLLLMQNKKDYKKAFGVSPDRADGFILSFAPVGKNGMVQTHSAYETMEGMGM